MTIHIKPEPLRDGDFEAALLDQVSFEVEPVDFFVADTDLERFLGDDNDFERLLSDGIALL